MIAKYLNSDNKKLVAFYYAMDYAGIVPVVGDLIDYDGEGFEVRSRTFYFSKRQIEIRATIL